MRSHYCCSHFLLLVVTVIFLCEFSGFFVKCVDFLEPTDSEALERPCIEFAPVENSKFPIQPLTTLFATFGSRAFFRSYFEMFNGRPAISEDELAHLCPFTLYTDLIGTQFASGKIIVGRNPNGPLVIKNPTILAASPSVSMELLNATVETVIWTTEDHILLAGCNGAGFKEWVLFSLKLPSSEIKKTVLEKIVELGFNETLAWDLTNPGQTKSPFYCPSTPPSWSDAALQALDILGLFTEGGALYEPFNETILWQGEEFSRLYDYYKSFLGSISPFFRTFQQNCDKEVIANDEVKIQSQTTGKPAGCHLFDL